MAISILSPPVDPKALLDQTAFPGVPQNYVNRLIDSGVLPERIWTTLSDGEQDELTRTHDPAALVSCLADRQLLTRFQADHLRRTGNTNGLIFGNYRLLEIMGTGRSNVFRAEHQHLGTPVAVKVVSAGIRTTTAARERFFRVVRAAAQFSHPGLAPILDAGYESSATPDGDPVPYVVMPILEGHSLEEWVRQRGPLSVSRACEFVSQIADALIEPHRIRLYHRHIHPGNVFLSTDGQARLLDFGVACLTAGTPTSVVAPPDKTLDDFADARADIFALGAILRYALYGNSTSVGQTPGPLPAELNEVLARLAAPDPSIRPKSVEAVVRMLAPFQGWHVTLHTIKDAPAPENCTLPPSNSHGILIVDDEPHIRQICRLALEEVSEQFDEVDNGVDAVSMLTAHPYDVVLLDMDLPRLSGSEVLKQVRTASASPHLKVIVLSGQGGGDHLSGTLFAGADDFLAKPFSVTQLRARVAAAIRLKAAQDRTDTLTRRLATANSELEQAVNARDGELIHARSAMVLALCHLVEKRSRETGPHLIRIQRYTRVLGSAAASTLAFVGRLTPEMLQIIEAASPLHDIGKVTIPDNVLNKPGILTPEERIIMQSHAAAGAETLSRVTKGFQFASAFLQTATEIARHHHERWDGTGYPDRLAGESIPLSARLVAIGDVYDALRSQRVYKPGYPHEAAVRRILLESPGHFEPALLQVFSGVADQFNEIFQSENSD